MGNLDAAGLGPAFIHGALADVDVLKGLGRGLGRLLLGLARGGGFIKEHEGHGKDHNAEVADITAQINFSRGQHRNQVSAQNAAAGQTEPQRQHQSAHTIISNGGNEGRQAHQVLVAHPDGVGEQLVQGGTGLFKTPAVIRQAKDRDVADAGHDPAEGAHRGKDPAYPNAPQDVKQPERMGRAGDAHEPLGHVGVDHAGACTHGGLGNSLLELAGPGRLRQGQGGQHGHGGQEKDDKSGFVPHAILLHQ